MFAASEQGGQPSSGELVAESGPSATKPVQVHGKLRRYGDVGEPLTVALIRHGQTPMTVAGEYSGSSVVGPGLNAAGRIEAAQAADLMARLGRTAWADLPRPSELITSPMTRTQETASAVSRRTGLVPRTVSAFAEADFGTWEGRTASDIGASEGEQLIAWHTTGVERAPGGESAADVGVRVESALQDLVAAGTGRTAIVVAHTIVIRAAVGMALQAPASTWNHLRITPGSVTILRRWPDGMTEVAALGYAPL